MQAPSSRHKSVLLDQLVDSLNLSPGATAIDCTLGAGGHTEVLLSRVGVDGLVIGIDRDSEALAIASQRLQPYIASGNLKLIKARFSDIESISRDLGVYGSVQGICADIGVSSMHLDQAARGFSFQGNGPLDMRMDPEEGQTAADLIANADAETLTDIFRQYGEEPKARQIARRIVEQRDVEPITTTHQLAELVKAAARYPTASRKHPATRVFQALRMVVNDEIGELKALLNRGLGALRSGGRLSIISFHSLEDRVVKQTFVDFSGRTKSTEVPRDLPITATELKQLIQAKADIIKPFPTVPTAAEIAENPRSRSAKLRIIAKL